MIKGRSIFSLMLSLTIVGFGEFTKPQLSAMANQSLIDNIVTDNSQVIDEPQNLAQQPKSQLVTWREFVERGGRCFVNRDYDLPAEFRNGYVYINPGADNTTAYILKQGLSSYPPIKSGIGEIDYAMADSYVKSGKAIKFNWGGSVGSYQTYGKDTKLRFVKETGQFCLRLSCLEAPFMTKQEINRILRSERAIKQKN